MKLGGIVLVLATLSPSLVSCSGDINVVKPEFDCHKYELSVEDKIVYDFANEYIVTDDVGRNILGNNVNNIANLLDSANSDYLSCKKFLGEKSINLDFYDDNISVELQKLKGKLMRLGFFYTV